jgi:hypothetical protein
MNNAQQPQCGCGGGSGCARNLNNFVDSSRAMLLPDDGKGQAMIFWDPKVIDVTTPRGARSVSFVSASLLLAGINNDILANPLGAEAATMNSGSATDSYVPPSAGAQGGQRYISFVDLEFTMKNLGINTELSASLTCGDMNLRGWNLTPISVKFLGNCTTANIYVCPCSATAGVGENPGDDTSPRTLLSANALFGVYTRAFATVFTMPPGAAADDFTLTRRFFDTRRTAHLEFKRLLERGLPITLTNDK